MHRRFKWLLRLLPGAFREEHGAELLRVWQDELRESSPRSHGRIWRRAATDTLRVAPTEFASAAIQNLRLALRTLRRAPAFAIAAIATLALGIGATAAIFSLINVVLIRPLPWHDPDAVGLVWALAPSGDRTFQGSRVPGFQGSRVPGSKDRWMLRRSCSKNGTPPAIRDFT